MMEARFCPAAARRARAADSLVAAAMLAAGAPALHVCYVDDHFVPREGAKPVPKGWNTKRRHAQPGRAGTVVTDYRGRAACFADGDPSGLAVTLPPALAQPRQVTGPDAPALPGFDRGGSFPAVFRACRAAAADWVTWRRGPLAPCAAAPRRHRAARGDGRPAEVPGLAGETVTRSRTTARPGRSPCPRTAPRSCRSWPATPRPRPRRRWPGCAAGGGSRTCSGTSRRTTASTGSATTTPNPKTTTTRSPAPPAPPPARGYPPPAPASPPPGRTSPPSSTAPPASPAPPPRTRPSPPPGRKSPPPSAPSPPPGPPRRQSPPGSPRTSSPPASRKPSRTPAAAPCKWSRGCPPPPPSTEPPPRRAQRRPAPHPRRHPAHHLPARHHPDPDLTTIKDRLPEV